MEVRNFPPALELFSGVGARVASTRVRIGPDLVERALASAPRSWPVSSRGSEAEMSVDAEALAVDEIMAVGPGGHHLARKYTRHHNRDFWIPMLFDRIVYDRWAAEGSRTLKDRVRARVDALRAEEPSSRADDATRHELAELLRAAEEQRSAAET